MNIPGFGKPQNEDPYVIPQPGADNKKTTMLMFGGLAVLLLLLGLILFGGGSSAGQTELKGTIDSTAESLGVINDYDRKLKSRATQDDIALVKTILLGNYEKLIALYQKNYSAKAKFTKSPKADTASKARLESAIKNDTQDSEIIEVLKPKIIQARKYLITTKPHINTSDGTLVIETAQSDYLSITEILEKSR